MHDSPLTHQQTGSLNTTGGCCCSPILHHLFPSSPSRHLLSHYTTMGRYLYDHGPWPSWEPRRAKVFFILIFQYYSEASSSPSLSYPPKFTCPAPSPPRLPDINANVVHNHRHVLNPTVPVHTPPSGPDDPTPTSSPRTHNTNPDPYKRKSSSAPSFSSNDSVSSYVCPVRLWPTPPNHSFNCHFTNHLTPNPHSSPSPTFPQPTPSDTSPPAASVSKPPQSRTPSCTVQTIPTTSAIGNSSRSATTCRRSSSTH